MIISAIVAKATNNAIGIDNDLPWHLPGDLKWFKQKTLGRHIIMGRRSFESLPKALPNRTSIVITRDKKYFNSSCLVVHNIPDALELAHSRKEEEVFILGGGKIYDQTKGLWDRLYLTDVMAAPEADTFFPEFDLSRFELTFQEKHWADERNKYDYTFNIYDRQL